MLVFGQFTLITKESSMQSTSSAHNPCNPEIFKDGKGVCIVEGSSDSVELWVRLIAQRADARVDWHFNHGKASVLHLGDDASRQRVIDTINKLKNNLRGTVISVNDPAAIYRFWE